MKNQKKLAFCITCMNRLPHLQETLVKNMKDNFLPDKVEFILLDYNSKDGLEEWVKTLQSYINIDILHYYRTDIPAHYHRSHSRNMAFRLAGAEIICNLDADNFLGEGFATYILQEFENFSGIRTFITSSCHHRDSFGRVCLRMEDFCNIHGYNELLGNYGAEDLDLFNRLLQSGMKQKIFWDERFYGVIHHSNLERIINEYRYKQLSSLYLSYVSPYKVLFFANYKNGICESGSLINNELCNFNHNKQFSNIVELFYDGVYRTMLDSPMLKEKKQLLKGETIVVRDSLYYKIKDKEIIATFIFYLSDAVNFETIRNVKNMNENVNPSGFGQGTVYKNFNYSNPIILD